MAALKSAWLALPLVVLAWSGPAPADPLDRWAPLVAEASARFGLPPEWIRQVMRAESGGRTTLAGRPIVSRAGAMGLMQLMPATWQEMRARLGLGSDPHDPRDNILAGAGYLRMMYDRFGHPGLFAAYNAGPARYARHRATGRPLPAETVAYLAAVAGGPAAVGNALPSGVPAAAPAASLFALRADTRPDRPAAGASPPASPSAALFVPLRRDRAP
jgi:soluble lytic murein transglycosylase-like protein